MEPLEPGVQELANSFDDPSSEQKEASETSFSAKGDKGRERESFSCITYYIIVIYCFSSY